jgi:cation-transporting ATPase E
VYSVFLIARTDPTATDIQQSTAAVVALFVVATWVLLVVARPLAWWKVGMVAVLAAAFCYALFVPAFFGQTFWELDPSHAGVMLPALIVAVIAAALVEVADRVIRRTLR